jgi:glutathione S-transferase
MRARIAIYKSKLAVELRDLVLTDKPAEMLAASPKGTVPTLVISPSTVIDESVDVMLWILAQSDPFDLLRMEAHRCELTHCDTNQPTKFNQILALVYLFDSEFKPCLEAYKCAKRYHEDNLLACREACEVFIQNLEQRLNAHRYLIDNKESMADIALLPFIRQFAKVERQWYLQSNYPNVKRWLNQYLQSPMFNKVMKKYPLWLSGQEVLTFGDI